jgi:hypothetical protein
VQSGHTVISLKETPSVFLAALAVIFYVDENASQAEYSA